MPYFLGIDTSNYTTSAAVFDSDTKKIIQKKKLLPVKDGELGLRQSEALFHHTVQLPQILSELFGEFTGRISSVSVSVKPRNIENSYMPCFLAGRSAAYSSALVLSAQYHETSHQTGHILAALYSAERLDIINSSFIAFHVSGGTTDCLLVEPDAEDIIRVTEIGTSLDLKAGQAVDRIGLMLGLKFPCGAELEKLALKSNKKYNIKTVLKGNSCCLSGIENKCRALLNSGEPYEDIANFCLAYIYSAVREMTLNALNIYGSLPVVFSGGVMSDSIIKQRILSEFKNSYFAEPQYSCDNAAGTAIFGYLSEGK